MCMCLNVCCLSFIPENANGQQRNSHISGMCLSFDYNIWSVTRCICVKKETLETKKKRFDTYKMRSDTLILLYFYNKHQRIFCLLIIFSTFNYENNYIRWWNITTCLFNYMKYKYTVNDIYLILNWIQIHCLHLKSRVWKKQIRSESQLLR